MRVSVITGSQNQTQKDTSDLEILKYYIFLFELIYQRSGKQSYSPPAPHPKVVNILLTYLK